MTTTDPLLNRLFDRRYLIQRKLGSGGMADVYLAEDQELGRRVALKLLDDRHASDEQFVERFRREAQNAAGLNHPNIVSIFDRGQAEDTYYIAMEFLDGRTLKELVVRNGPTPIPIAIDYARQILQALAFAHRHGIVHRDIKPHNIVVGRDGRLKVTDFGIARSGASQMTEAGSIVGTAQYLSPEQARGAQVDPRSDLYSLGIVLYEMLTGKVPFTGDAPVEIAMKHLSAVAGAAVEAAARGAARARRRSSCARSRRTPTSASTRPRRWTPTSRASARGLAVSRRTEEAATQVLRGEDTAGGDDGRAPADDPAGAARLPAARRVLRGAAAALALAVDPRPARARDRRRHRLPALRQGAGPAQREPAGDGGRRRPDPVHAREAAAPGAGLPRPCDQLAEPHRRVGAVRQDPPAASRAEGLDRHAVRLDRATRNRRCPTCAGLTQTDAITALVHAGLNANRSNSDSQRAERTGLNCLKKPRAGQLSCRSGSEVRINAGGRAAGRRARA